MRFSTSTLTYSHTHIPTDYDETWDFFRYMARLDLDNYNRNTDQGLHVTSMSGAWLNMVYGWGGLRTDGKTLSFIPCIPEKWTSFGLRLQYRGRLLEINVDRQLAHFRVLIGSRGISVALQDSLPGDRRLSQ